MSRRLPIGAELMPGGGVHFRVWAPKRSVVEVVLEDGSRFPLEREDGGYFSGPVRWAAAGTRYRFRLDQGEMYPDPASRFQPEGPHGPSQVVDPSSFPWSDDAWHGPVAEQAVLYELHVGTFTKEGTWSAAIERLEHLKELGVSVIEMMPVADFPGRFGWGYDGVNLFAPTRLYGQPDDLRRFVNRAHELGLAVILDVVYNHLGPDGNYLSQFADDYFSRTHRTDWGEALNFDGPNNRSVREFFVTNAVYWIREFHFDGLRLDATQQIFDDSRRHILAEIAQQVRREAGRRRVYLVAENDQQWADLIRAPEQCGMGFDAVWNDDFHHAAVVAATGRNEAYLRDFRGTPQELISSVKRGFLFQGQWSGVRENPRGMPAWDLPPSRFIHFLENHDQIANTACGRRLHQRTSPGRWRALTALFLLAPPTPMLFQGQEFSADAPFHFFADHEPDLARKVAEGRFHYLCQFPSFAAEGDRGLYLLPHDVATFERCKLEWSQRERNQASYRLHADLLQLRRTDPVFSQPRRDRLDGALLGERAFVLRWFADDGQDRLLLVDLGTDLTLHALAEPLLAPPRNHEWQLARSSEEPRYSGEGTPALDGVRLGLLRGDSAIVLRPRGRQTTAVLGKGPAIAGS
ncbi:MAG: malto-oligosyltrehalose trehalohydrolase [Gemmataceae bacterium]|nr:malto-oligosyltrehalose trehalohydrolase [Gemmataceae bacterium]